MLPLQGGFIKPERTQRSMAVWVALVTFAHQVVSIARAPLPRCRQTGKKPPGENNADPSR
ncbi:hypothetical protein HA41_06345 [Pantoea conspicua]|uniref:Uncharacterized protein n=1 Tax=Pantoea conspicua TaxID=472705 RepID=A0A1X1BZ05_9GAMM|nr:hypothetical protein HA41_06345 [Pantoea conspicua]